MLKDIRGDIVKGNFQNGKIVFYISGLWDVQDFIKVKVLFVVVLLLKIDDGKLILLFVGVQVVFVLVKFKNKDVVFKFMKYFVENFVLILFKVGYRIFVLNKVLISSEVKVDKIMSVFVEQVKVGIFMLNILEMFVVWGLVNNVFLFIIIGKVILKQVVDVLVKQIKQGIVQM